MKNCTTLPRFLRVLRFYEKTLKIRDLIGFAHFVSSGLFHRFSWHTSYCAMGQLISYLFFGYKQPIDANNVDKVNLDMKCILKAYYKTEYGFCIQYVYNEKHYFVNFSFENDFLEIQPNYETKLPEDNVPRLFVFEYTTPDVNIEACTNVHTIKQFIYNEKNAKKIEILMVDQSNTPAVLGIEQDDLTLCVKLSYNRQVIDKIDVNFGFNIVANTCKNMQNLFKNRTQLHN